MADNEDKNRVHLYLDPLLTRIIEDYAKAQRVTFGTIVRRFLSHVLYNEIQQKDPSYKPKERRKNW